MRINAEALAPVAMVFLDPSLNEAPHFDTYPTRRLRRPGIVTDPAAAQCRPLDFQTRSRSPQEPLSSPLKIHVLGLAASLQAAGCHILLELFQDRCRTSQSTASEPTLSHQNLVALAYQSRLRSPVCQERLQ